MKQLTFLALVAIFSISTGSVMAQKNSSTNKNKATLSGPKLNSSSKTSATSASSVGKKGQLTNKARSACIKGVWKLAKTQHYGPKGETVEVKSKLEYACTKLRNMVKPSFKYAVQMGVLVKAGKTATKTLKTCHVEMKDIVHKKKLVPAVTSSMLRKGLDKLCFRTKFDGYRALKIALQAGLFKTGRRP